jgi:signal transduction histidine kinase
MSTSDTSIRAAILRAKDEWECTVDALPDLICLLDAAGRVVRINRMVERWELYPLPEALGLDLHTLLHPGFDEGGCPLAAALAAAWSALQQSGDVQEFELRDPRLGRALHVTLRKVPPDADAKMESLSVAVVADVTALHLAREALNAINQELEARVQSRTSELAESNRDLQNEIARREGAEQAVRRSRNELATLSHQLMIAQEAERKRIARELHDSVGQQLSAIKYTLERVDGRPRQDGETQVQIERAITSLQEAMDELRTIAMNLRPAVLDDLGAVSAVSWFCRQFGQNYPALALREQLSVADADVPERLSTAVFRSLQEMLNNVAKHARAREVVVTLSRAAGQLILEVEDDGVGIQRTDPDAGSRTGRGLRNLRERASMTGGEFMVGNRPEGAGTRARIEWHLPATRKDSSNAA